MSGLKTFNIRLPKDIWIFLREESTAKEKSMNFIIVEALEKLRKKRQKELENK